MHEQTKLQNGINLILSKNTSTNTATVLVMVKTGSKNESKDTNGISHFLEHLMFKGTKEYESPHKLSIALDNLGGEFNAYTSEEFTGYWIKIEHSKLESALALLSEMLINSTFPEEEINRERGVIIEEMNMIQDDPMRHIYSLFTQCLYGDTPAGRKVIGPKENIETITRETILNYYKTQYNPNNLTIAITGNISNANTLAEKYFNFTNNSQKTEAKKVTVKQTKPNIEIINKKTDQAHLSLGFHAYNIDHPKEMTLKLLAAILGGSMSSRLFMELREKKGLAYYTRTFPDFYSDCGYMTTNAAVPATKLEEAIKIILNEYKIIKEIPVTEDELNKVKNIIKGKLAIELEQSDEVAEWYAESHLIRGRIITPEEYISKIEKVSIKDIQDVANELFTTNNINLAIIGDCKDKEEYTKLLIV